MATIKLVMEAIMAVKCVWIQPGCIRCNACAFTEPLVFSVPNSECAVILGNVRDDGVTSPNRDERIPLRSDLGERLHDKIAEAADGCPVGIIKYE